MVNSVLSYTGGKLWQITVYLSLQKTFILIVLHVEARAASITHLVRCDCGGETSRLWSRLPEGKKKLPCLIELPTLTLLLWNQGLVGILFKDQT